MLAGAKAVVRLLLGLVATALLLASCHKLSDEYEIAPNESDPNAGDGLCTPGQWKCNREFLLECTADRKFVTRDICPTANQCDQNAKVCTVCPQEGARRCNGAKREVCGANRASWNEVEACVDADQCSPTFCGDCTPGELQCSGPLTNELRVCTADNRWQTVASCESASLCMASVSMGMADMTWTPACLPPQCDAGVLSCDGSVLYRCRQGRDGFDKVDVCSSPALCQMAATAPDGQSQTQSMCPLGCAPAGSFRCMGQNVEQCSFDQTTWTVVHTCNDTATCDSMTGECGGPCVPGAQRCNAASLETCSPEQTWVVKEVCATGALCSPDEPTCRPPACLPDATRCNPDSPTQLERCNDDRTGYTSVATCRTAELCSCALDNSCTAGIDQDGCGMPVCMPLDDGELPLKCDPADELKLRVQICDASLNKWNPLITCSNTTEPKEFCYPQDRADPCKTECPASGSLCDGTELLRCGLNGPVHQADCATATLCECAVNGNCVAGVGATGCGSPLCGGTLASNQCNESTLQTCQVGRNGWDELECGLATLCYPGIPPAFTGGYCAICEIPGVISCTPTATAIHTCAPDRRGYTAETPCAFGCLERPGPSADYCAACAEGELRCNGTAPGASRVQQCNADRSALVDVVGGQCASGCLDMGTADQCAVCQANEFRCEGTQRMRCNATRTGLTLDTACNPSCIDSGIADYCGTCTPGATQCSGDLLQTCQASGAWNAGSSCANGCVVKDGNDNCAPTCRPGTYRCTGSPPAALQQCNANGDGWTAMTTCTANDAGTGGPALCDAVNGRCDACVAGDYRCSNGTLQDCNANGDWKTASGPCSGNVLRTCGAGTGPATASTCTICDASNRECDDCNPTTEPYSCSSGTLRSCNASGHWVSGAANCSGATLRTCTGNTLNPAQTCTICDEVNNECDDCSGSTFRCAGNTNLQACNSTGHWMASPACPSTGATLYTCNTGTTSPATSTCPMGQTCNAAQTLCNMCDNGQTRCFDMDTQQTCASMMWGSNLECGVAGCQSNTCNDCLPSTWKACNAAGTQLLTCGVNGDYPGTGMTCPNGCFGDEPDAYCGDCTPGDTACFSGSIRTCGANGRYPTTGGTPCGANGCFETTPGEAACGVCSGTSTQCMGKQRQTCSSGQWSNTGTACTGNCAVLAGVATCVACNTTADCASGLVCDTAAHTCVECLVDGDCDEGVCTADNECIGCEVDADCDGGVCTADNECVECEVNGDCAVGEVCNTTTNTCNDCAPSSTTCNVADTQLLTCGANGSYPATGMNCPNGCFGDEPDAYCGDCTPGDTACFSGSIRTCGANGRYPASGGTPCGANGCFETTPGVAACGVCSGASTQCMGKQRQTCSSGQWTNTGAACAGNCALVATVATCVACNVTADCASGVCDTAAHTCEECLVDGDCGANQVCTAANECVACEVDGDCDDGVCTAANECVECEVSADCTMEVCRTADNTCVQCLVNGDCPVETPTCNMTTNVCE
jgi:hypothetical protein